MDSPGEGLPDPLAELAAAGFGVPYLYPIQRFVISNTLEGADQIVVLPTGAGKSLCFQIPAFRLPGPTLVIVPLLSLLADQVRRLTARGLAAEALRGGLTRPERDSLFARVRSGEVRIILATPEACLAPETEAALAGLRISHLVVDEAHCLSEWGRTFRPAFRELAGLSARLGSPRLTAFTATASEPVLADVRALLFADREVRVVEANPDRPNIRYAVVPTLCRLRTAGRILSSRAGAAVVFCGTRRLAELAARELGRRAPGRQTFFYHAGLTRAERQRIEGWYLPSSRGVLCATSAFGLGVDKPDIRTVIHLDAPPSVEAYLQETGRAGRDGGGSEAILLSSPAPGIFGFAAADEVSRRRYRNMLDYARGTAGCRRQALLALIGKEALPCSGCDVCDGTARNAAEGREEILAFTTVNRRRFTPGEAAEILCGAPGPRVTRGFLDRERGYGSLAGWERGDAEEALAAMRAAGALSLVRWGPWRGRLTTAARR